MMKMITFIANRKIIMFVCQRIDMVPELLSSNLCSLRGGEERYFVAFLKINCWNTIGFHVIRQQNT